MRHWVCALVSFFHVPTGHEEQNGSVVAVQAPSTKVPGAHSVKHVVQFLLGPHSGLNLPVGQLSHVGSVVSVQFPVKIKPGSQVSVHGVHSSGPETYNKENQINIKLFVETTKISTSLETSNWTHLAERILSGCTLPNKEMAGLL